MPVSDAAASASLEALSSGRTGNNLESDSYANTPRQRNKARARVLFSALDAAKGQLDPGVWPRLRRQALAISTCREVSWIGYDSETRAPRVVPIHCHSRLCAHCAGMRARQIAAMITDAAAAHDGQRFITLTIKSSDDPLPAQVNRLMTAWRKLRGRKWWKERVTGGIYTVEITYNTKRRQWHPHIHAIVSGAYVHQPDLRDKWLEITGDSTIVDIRFCYSRSALARELASYIAKTGKPLKVPESRILQYADAITGVRLVQSWGTWHGTKLKPPKEPGTSRMVVITSMATLRLEALSGDDTAQELWNLWKRIETGATVADPESLVAKTEDWYRMKHRPP